MGIMIYALIRIFTYKAIVFEEEPRNVISRTVVTTTPKTTITPPTIITQTRPKITTTAPVEISNIPQTQRRSALSTSVSDVPVTLRQRSALNEELINLEGALDQ